MKGFFAKDSVLKVVSFVIAVLLWFYIIAVVDPSVDITVRDIPIRYQNQAMLEERGLSLVADPDASVELKIRGSRKKIASIDNKNVYATVDLANMTKVGTFSLPISISVPYEYDEIVSKNPYNASVVIDKIVTAERTVDVVTTSSVANGYIATTPVPSVKTVTLKGASTLVEKIRGVAATLDFDGRSAEIKDKAELYFVDGNGKKIDKNDSIYSSVEMSMDSVEITCPVFKIKTVPVVVDDSSIKSEYKVSVQPSNVTVYAENGVLENVTEILVERLDVAKLKEEGMQTVGLVIPEGVSMRDGITEITVKAEKRN
ncbi:MAG: hypothetical protein IJW15_03080 [Clostridia bacterium]|nr:hypothetical protein [Clostridia bacterium]